MKKCFGCKQNLPLGSGRFHYINYDGDKPGTFITREIPCTHNPITNVAYNILCQCNASKNYVCTRCIVEADPQMSMSAPSLLFGKSKKCECGAEKCNTTHSHWCPKYRS